MDNLQTMDLTSGDSGMVSLPPPSGNTNIEVKPPEKNMSTNNKDNIMEMNATPIDEVMDAPMAQDPRMMPGHPQPSQPVMMAAPPIQQQAAQPQAQVQSLPSASKNPLNLTDDQMEALFVGLVATLAYSRPVQEKMAQMVPQFMGENGSRSTVGMILSGVIAAILYFFGRRFIMRN